MSPYVKIAQDAIDNYVRHGRILKAATYELKDDSPAGCFVSLHLADTEELRGCIGTISPTCPTLIEEIINNAISACNDPRFIPLAKEELDNLKISVDVLEKPKKISSEKELNVKTYGVIVKSKDGRTGLLLPDIDGVDTVEKQISIARQKAGILSSEDIDLYRFKVNRYF